MDEKERKNIIDVLIKSKKAIRKHDIVSLKYLSDRTIHSSSIEQDSDYIFIAVAIYSLYKIYSRDDYRKYKAWVIFHKTVIANLEKGKQFLKHRNEGGYERCMRNILKVGGKLSGELKDFVKVVVERSKVSKGSRVYEHGISLGRSAELLGVSAFELLEYAGNTGIGDAKLAYTLDIKKRLDIAREIFK